MSFGYGTGEFEVTRDRLGCYRPEEHIDNPRNYADNEDARRYDRRLRGPVDEKRELTIDERTGLKRYIATEDVGITTSAGLVRNLFGRAIQLGRDYGRTRNKAEFYEALRLLGTGCHCLEDYSAHSNYTELALIEMGEHNIFPHVGRNTRVHIRGARGPVYPIITGTFGGVDFLHSVMGEFSDKTTQSEIQELEGTFQQAQGQDVSLLKNLLSSLPDGLFGNNDQAGKADELQANATAAHMQHMNISPKEPEEFTRQLDELTKQIYPILEFHDEIMKGITETIDKIPVLPDLVEQVSEQLSVFVFSLLAPFVVPIIKQVKTELATGSSEVIQSSRNEQLIVFHDDDSTDPTHSMLSKDHFSNILNEPAGKVASQVLKWVVPQIVQCWDDERIDVDRTLDRIINGVFHHPAMRQYGDDGARDGRMLMFGVVEQWWRERSERERDDLRDRLSRDGVEHGRNHKEGVHDSGHGCGKPIGLPNQRTAGSSGAPGGVAAAAIMGGLNDAFSPGGQRPHYGNQPGAQAAQQVGNLAAEAVGGGALGGIVGGLIGGVGAELLGDAFSQNSGAQTQTFENQGYNPDGSYTSRVTETGHRPGGYGREERYGQAEVKQTRYPDGARREEYQRFEQDGPHGRTGFGFEQSVETRPISGGGYEQRSERRWDRPDGKWESEVQTQRVSGHGDFHQSEERHHGRRYDESDDDDSDDDGDWEKKERKRRAKAEKKERKRREEEEEERRGEHRHEHERREHYGGRDEERREEEHGGRHSREHERREEYGMPGGFPGGREEHGERRHEYGGREEAYGRHHGGYEQQEQRPAYGGFEGRNEGYGGGGYEGRNEGFGGGYGQERPGYGGGGHQQEERPYGGGYERRQEYGGGDGGYGSGNDQMPGGFGEEEGYGERRRYRKGGGGYGGGYGGGEGW